MKTRIPPRLLLTLFCSLIFAASAIFGAEDTTPPAGGGAAVASTTSNDTDSSAMARKLANPVGSIYSVPIETTFDYGAANGDATFIRIQPVIPVTLSEDWNLINRTIVPLIDAPGVPVGTSGNPEPEFGPRKFGLGDINHSMFLSPAAPGKWIWGAGTVLGLPTATSSQLGSEKWLAGPTAVVLTQPKPWTFGVLAGNVWSFAGASDRSSVNQLFVQPFVNYSLKGGWYATSSPILTANWNASSSDRWSIPLGAGFGKLFKIGGQNVRAQVQGLKYVERPSGGPDWAFQFTVQFVFPRS